MILMKSKQFNLGVLDGREVIEVTLSKGEGVDIKLLDSVNFQNFKEGLKYFFLTANVINGVAKMEIPSTGRWFLIIDVDEENEDVKTSIRIF